MYLIRPFAAGLAALSLLSSCLMSEAEPASPPEPPVALEPVTVHAIDSTTAAAAAAAAARAATDTTKEPPVTVPSVRGRSKRDSLALVSAVRAGMKDTKWPVKGPDPLP